MGKNKKIRVLLERIEQLESAIEQHPGADIWRFWSDKAYELAVKNNNLYDKNKELKNQIEAMKKDIRVQTENSFRRAFGSIKD